MSDQVYHDAMRHLQDRFGTRALADKLAEKRRRAAFTDEDRAFVESRPFVFLATADAQGAPDCSYKGLLPGHLRVTGPSSLSLPSIDGNGMYRSLGNIIENPGVGLLFMSFDSPQRLRVNGRARVVFDDPRMADIPGAEAMLLVEDVAIFSNCPRYIQTETETSGYFDQGEGAPDPEWKTWADFAPLLPGDKS